jgi:hypothetical protein
MLGIQFKTDQLQGFISLTQSHSFNKPIVLPPDAELRCWETENKTNYYFKHNQKIRFLPDPVYNLNQVYYIREDKKMTAQNARYFIKITDCILKLSLQRNMYYTYEFEFVKP